MKSGQNIFTLLQQFPAELQEEIKEDILEYAEFLYFKHVDSSRKKVKKNPWGLSPKDQTELKRRVKNAKENPDKLRTWEQILQGLEKKNGKKISI